ncbi:MAG TPA: NUDIX domain-containing protein [Burkholderiales bacterium]
MNKRSAGLLMYRRKGGMLEVLLAHPGGPFWAKKEVGAWSIPKGEYGDDEAPLDAAKREFREETGFTITPPFIALGELKQKGGKVVAAWAFKGNADPALLKSNTFEMEWPPKSGKMQGFPEVDRVAWFGVEEARRRINAGQCGFIEELVRSLGERA